MFDKQSLEPSALTAAAAAGEDEAAVKSGAQPVTGAEVARIGLATTRTSTGCLYLHCYQPHR